jgi:hypothetical protein
MVEDAFRTALIEALLAKRLKGRPGVTEALYVLHFGKVERPEGLVNGGVAVLETGRVFGGDSGYYYTGTYTADGDTLEAVVTVQRHNAGWLNVWGDCAEAFVVRFTGQRNDGGAVIEGQMHRLDMPDHGLVMKWFRMADLP